MTNEIPAAQAATFRVMKILFVSHCAPWLEGGAESRARAVISYLITQGHSVTVLCGKACPDDPAVGQLHGATVICKRVLPDWLLRKYPYPHYLPLAFANALLMFYLWGLLRQEQFDLLREDLSPFPPSGLLALARLQVPQRIAVVHNLSDTLTGWVRLYGVLYGLAGFVMDRLLRAGWMHYQQIICDSEWFARELRRSPAIAARVRYVPNGVSLGDFQCGARDYLNTNFARPIRILNIARLAETKGHRYLIEAVAHLRNNFPGLCVDIYGAGNLKESLLALTRQLGIAEQVRFCRPLPNTEICRVYCAYDIFVLPSVFEGLPLVILEAMASRLPIIASDIPAVTALLDNYSALLFATENSHDLAEKLRWALQHLEEMTQRADIAYQRVQQFDWSVVARQEIEVH